MNIPELAPAKAAILCPTICNEPKNPRRSAGALSTKKAVALANSPPVAKPCNNLAVTIKIGAAAPIIA